MHLGKRRRRVAPHDMLEEIDHARAIGARDARCPQCDKPLADDVDGRWLGN